MLSNTLSLNFCHLKIIHILHLCYHQQIIGHSERVFGFIWTPVPCPIKCVLSCFVDFLLCPTDIYMLKVNNKKKNRLICMCSSLNINTACHCSFVFIADFDHSQHINIAIPRNLIFFAVSKRKPI